ncbi:patatin-like phospholipase family protein [Dyadobacter sp. CY326]|uniref:patatin-like phospholipase family protein n=1 Tax=Dyadobacter sp. CY326 TaxID=2907300 RepID=UPI001F19EB1E|nr:patatin-like phospholipase family protein [Dyadobacter sp. CY326]MCE7066964.1 patatin-like phospholipase family protein [Dyadobacter sp. CY326]
MDIVTDLTSQAVSYLTLLQDVCKDYDAFNKSKNNNETKPNVFSQLPDIQQKIEAIFIAQAQEANSSRKLTFTTNKAKVTRQKLDNETIWKKASKRVDRMKEIVFTSQTGHEADLAIIASFFETSKNLFHWLKLWLPIISPQEKESFTDERILLMTPDEWRRIFRVILYEHAIQRIELIMKLRYMPLQIVASLGGSKAGYYQQRLYQVFIKEDEAKALEAEGHTLDILSKTDQESVIGWWRAEFAHGISEEETENKPRFRYVDMLLTNDEALIDMLIKSDNPVSFETMLNSELNSVDACRTSRKNDLGNVPVADFNAFVKQESVIEQNVFQLNDQQENKLESGKTKDPLARAQEMRLTGLSFSGGGIRSATFNLGVLQKLAEKGILEHIDYLSTVSGGGYIGSWFTSWIKRSGSVSKVTARLNSKKSADPMADEVRPIRWLRMYSNYLSPDASIMSTDAWTMGITWLRNTLINQFILLLLLCTALSMIENIFQFWDFMAQQDSIYRDRFWPYFLSLLIFLGAGLAAAGMRTFDKEYPNEALTKYGRHWTFSYAFAGWAFISAFMVSAWFANVISTHYMFSGEAGQFMIPAFSMAVSLILIALLGNYRSHNRIRSTGEFWFAIVLSSVLATSIAAHLLIGVFHIFQNILGTNYHYDCSNWSFSCMIGAIAGFAGTRVLTFIIGIPLVLEAICWAVIIRMYIMGIMFPDERREWWGRMGAIIHRFILFWILVTACVFILPKAPQLHDSQSIISLLGGWAAIVGAGVRLAFSSTSSPENKSKSGLNVKEVFIRAAPYLFIIGFLLLGSYTLNFFHELKWFGTELPQSLMHTFLIGLATVLLSWRAGVNEFSLHYFYRNRLVRAYLGATRRRTERTKTVNPFTGFDSADDIKLSQMTPQNNYYGPFPLINTALNATVVSELDRQDRKAESFVFSPLFCGYDFSATRSASFNKNGVFNYGYRPSESFAGGQSLGTAMAISGAAVNPNMGYHSSAATAFLLTIFNVRLGWWIGNPRLSTWKRAEPPLGLMYTLKDLVGKSTADSNYVCLSDGGHFDNMGLYELVRRRCSLIILSDAEEDVDSLCEGLANAIRRCRIDFGVEIDIDVSRITDKNPDTKLSETHVVEGKIHYPGIGAFTGKLVYIKTALTKNASVDIREYKIKNPIFPQQSTGDQFFNEEQFESYRRLGYDSVM